MSRSSLEGELIQNHELDNLSEPPGLSHAPWQYDFGEGRNFIHRPNQPILTQLLSLFNLRGAEPRGDVIDLDDVPILGSAKRDRWTRSPREIRRYRRSICFRTLARGLCALPIVILLFFGVLHVLEVVVGRAHLFWNDRVYGCALLGKHSSLQSPVSHTAAVPIPCHSHNDYWRDEPLLDAIRVGCIGVEADVWLFDAELYVGHSASALNEEHTLQSLYIDPLLKLLARSSSAIHSTSGTVGIFETAPAQTLVLLIDFKNAAEEAFQVVQKQLQPLREEGLLSYWNGEEVISRAVTVVGTGSAPLEMVLGGNRSYRDIFFDAPLDALWDPPHEPIDESDPLHDKSQEMDFGTAMSLPYTSSERQVSMDSELYNTTTSYYASTSFSSAVGFVWRGHLSPRQMRIIRGQIRGAKQKGLKARYWGTPRWPTALRNHIWHVLVKEGADILNVDDLEAAALQDWTIPIHDNIIW